MAVLTVYPFAFMVCMARMGVSKGTLI
ncbi:hypothetical protein GPA_17470 [Gordonibacter pamelaeae 7-10-1-b]|uniref:Uncharacterized protein n=1 Tax=Gordonibacter pamelaeae 7-10-1-b TaxID=657308 RepID=D6E922_9ACTN|nr:hypothetical protein GPA_17470 [Gordonibacter pamelaeae 7-10-1-b]